MGEWSTFNMSVRMTQHNQQRCTFPLAQKVVLPKKDITRWTSDRYINFIQHGNHALSIDLKDVDLHIPILSLTITFYILFGSTNDISGRFCH